MRYASLFWDALGLYTAYDGMDIPRVLNQAGEFGCRSPEILDL